MLDGYHHSGSFCDFLEAIKKTHEVAPEISLHLSEVYLDEHVLITMTDILLSYKKFPEKKGVSKSILTQISVNSNRPFRGLLPETQRAGFHVSERKILIRNNMMR